MRARPSAVALVAVFAVGACTTEQVAGNTGDAAKLVGRVAVNTTVGATKLAYRGARGTYRAVQEARNPEGEPFPPGTFLCSAGEGVFVEAERGPDGSYNCDQVTS